MFKHTANPTKQNAQDQNSINTAKNIFSDLALINSGLTSSDENIEVKQGKNINSVEIY